MRSASQRLFQQGLALFWGFAEATVFFVVPDVLLSWLALRHVKGALLACAAALVGALLGGCLMWAWGRADAAAARGLLETIPAVSGAMIAAVRGDLVEHGLAAVLRGPFSGVPYKIYAVEAADLGYGVGSFLLISVPARLARFLLVTLAFACVSWALRRWLSLRSLQRLHVAGWAGFYLWFFAVMP